MERAILYEIDRQTRILAEGGQVRQETLGWSEARGQTYSQRSKEEAHDYRYFPEPDLPPLVVEPGWVKRVAAELPELPYARYQRFMQEYGLSSYNAWRLTEDQAVANYFELAVGSASPQTVANWILGDLFSLIHRTDAGADFAVSFERMQVAPAALGELASLVAEGQINQASGKEVLAEMFATGKGAKEIVAARGLVQVSDQSLISRLVAETLAENPKEVASYKAGKIAVSNFLFGQVMRKAAGRANPQVVQAELERQLTQ
jgi:aspartyl-tRNA(Asn)/glutamyl-tRNA(Gln) amidotransferase subunit B